MRACLEVCQPGTVHLWMEAMQLRFAAIDTDAILLSGILNRGIHTEVNAGPQILY